MNLGLSLLTLFPGRSGGTETYVRGLLSAFGTRSEPESVVVLANRHVLGPLAALEQGPVRFHHVRSYRPGDSAPTRLLAMTAAGVAPALAARDVPPGIDVVHYPVTVPIPRFRGPTVVSLHDVQHHDLPALFSRAERTYRRFAYDRAARQATLVVTQSEHARARVAELARVDPDRIAVIHSGIDHDRFRPDGADDERLLAELDLPERYVVYPANAWPHKNHERLIAALAAQPDDELALVLTGNPYGRHAELEAHAQRLGVGGRVHHLGFVARELVAPLYRRARALVFPSLYEGFGTPPLEAMACGCVVASSDRASLAEVCGDAAVLFDPEDVNAIAGAIERATGDKALRAELREKGLARAARFTWDASAEGHVAAYRRALELAG